MNLAEHEIEQRLRQAPAPQPPSFLRAALARQIALPDPTSAAPARLRTEPAEGRTWWRPRPWLNAWWPVAAATCLALACLVLVAWQQAEIGRLRQALEQLRPPAAEASVSAAAPSSTVLPGAAADLPDPRQEIQRLRSVRQAAAADVQALEALQAANRQLRQQLAAGPRTFTAEEVAAVNEQRDRASSIRCINNLKQLGLAARIWANDNADVLPPDLASMPDEISSPRVLVCPADTARLAAANWASFTMANCSYQYLAASASVAEASRIAFRCPIHGHICLCDGSVQGEVATKYPERLVLRNGQLWYGATAADPRERLVEVERPWSPAANADVAAAGPGAPAATGTVRIGTGARMDEHLARRYGLLPPASNTNPPPSKPSP